MTNTWTMMRTLTRQRSLTAFKTFIVTLVATVVSILLAMFTGEAKITVDFVLTLLFAYAVIGGLVFLLDWRSFKSVFGSITTIDQCQPPTLNFILLICWQPAYHF